MKRYRRTKEQKEAGKKRYQELWDNYKTDKWKKKSFLRMEIEDLIRLGEFTKAELIEIKDHIKKKAF